MHLKEDIKVKIKLIIFFMTFLGISESSAQSYLQKFVNMNPKHKQVYLYEEALKIRPITIHEWTPGEKTLTYQVKGCEFLVFTDKNNNVTSYELSTSIKCPVFEIKHGSLTFNSQKTSLNRIISHLNSKDSDCFDNYRFTVEWLRFLGNCCDYSDYNYLELSSFRMCNFAQITFTFNENDGVKKWKDTLIDAYGGSENVPEGKDGTNRDKINLDGKYNKLAEKLWGDRIPQKIRIY